MRSFLTILGIVIVIVIVIGVGAVITMVTLGNGATRASARRRRRPGGDGQRPGRRGDPAAAHGAAPCRRQSAARHPPGVDEGRQRSGPREGRPGAQLLCESRKLAAGDDDNFNVLDTKQITDAVSGTTRVMTMLLGAVAAVSLLVGGIGIMNIMLVSVTERTPIDGTGRGLHHIAPMHPVDRVDEWRPHRRQPGVVTA